MQSKTDIGEGLNLLFDKDYIVFALVVFSVLSAVLARETFINWSRKLRPGTITRIPRLNTD